MSAGTVTYLVRNDDETHPLEVVIEDAEGRVVHERSEPEFPPGDQIGARPTGHDAEEGPYSITVGLESLSVTTE